MNTPDDRIHQRIERVVLKAIHDATLCATMKDYDGANALLVDAAVEHEKVYGPLYGWEGLPE
jgi:hypothetical protein